MKLEGKKVVFLGDSITAGGGASCKENGYVEVFGRLTGSVVYNYGIGGTRIAIQKKPSEDPMYDRYFRSRVADMPESVDVIVVFGGTNDFGHGDAALGSFDSRDEYTFYGALHALILNLVSKYPESRLVFMTPLHRLDEEGCIVDPVTGSMRSLKTYVDIIKQVCEYYSIPVLDLYSLSGLQPAISEIQKIFMPDGLHPSDKGAERLAQLLAGFLNTL